MFHVMLVLPVILMMVAIAGVVLFGIAAVVGACIGGTSVAILVKNTLVKKLLLIGLGILLCIGLLCIIPIAMVYFGFGTVVFCATSGVIDLVMTLLAIWGIRLSRFVSHKTGRTALTVVFYLVVVAAISLAIFTVIASIFFL